MITEITKNDLLASAEPTSKRQDLRKVAANQPIGKHFFYASAHVAVSGYARGSSASRILFVSPSVFPFQCWVKFSTVIRDRGYI